MPTSWDRRCSLRWKAWRRHRTTRHFVVVVGYVSQLLGLSWHSWMRQEGAILEQLLLRCVDMKDDWVVEVRNYQARNCRELVLPVGSPEEGSQHKPSAVGSAAAAGGTAEVDTAVVDNAVGTVVEADTVVDGIAAGGIAAADGIAEADTAVFAAGDKATATSSY